MSFTLWKEYKKLNECKNKKFAKGMENIKNQPFKAGRLLKDFLKPKCEKQGCIWFT